MPSHLPFLHLKNCVLRQSALASSAAHGRSFSRDARGRRHRAAARKAAKEVAALATPPALTVTPQLEATQYQLEEVSFLPTLALLTSLYCYVRPEDVCNTGFTRIAELAGFWDALLRLCVPA
jgi:hypothetical protein